MALGSLVVEVAANVARFQSDMGRVAQIAETEAKRIDRGLGVISNSLKALGAGFVVGLSFDKIKDKIESTIQSAAGLQELAERTGATASQISALAAVAKLSGTDTDALATGLQKLSKATVDAKDGGAKTAAAFNAIGISVKQIKDLRANEVFELIARQQEKYAESNEKTAAMQALLGKSGANLLPVMKDIADVGDLQVKVTDEQARAALEYEKNLKRLDAAQSAIFKIVSFELLPVMNAFAKAMLESATQTNGVKGAVSDLAKDGSIRSWAESAATAVGFVVDAFDGVARTVQIVGKTIGAAAAQAALIAQGDFRGAMEAGKAWQAEVDAILNKTLFSDRLAKQLADARGGFVGPPEGPRPTPNFKPNSGDDSGAFFKKLLEGRLKAQEDFIADEKKRLQEREQYLAFYEKNEYLTVRQTEEDKQQAIRETLASTLLAYEREAAAIEAYLKTATKDSAAQDARNRLAEVNRKAREAQTEATKKLADSELRLVEVQRQFDLQTRERDRQDVIANQTAQFQIGLMGRSTLEVLKATEARRIQLDLEERIRIKQKEDPLVDTSEAVAQAAIQTARSSSLIEESYNKQRDAIFGAHEALRKYIEDSGNAGAQVQSLITDSLKGLEDALVQFATTGKLSWSSLEQTILTGITRIIISEQAIKPLAAYLQGGLDSGTGGGGLIGSFFKSLGIGGSTSGGGFGTGTQFGNQDFGGFFADGGYLAPGKWGVAGENGPERIYGGATGVTVQPNGSSASIVVYQSFAPGTSKQTIDQAAKAVGMQVRRSMARDS